MANIYAVYALISGNPGGEGQFCSLNLSPRWGGGGGNCNAFAPSQQDPRGKTRGICSTATILQMELETSAVPVYGRTGCVGEHVLVTGFRCERNAHPDPRQTTLQVQEELISRLPIEIYV